MAYRRPWKHVDPDLHQNPAFMRLPPSKRCLGYALWFVADSHGWVPLGGRVRCKRGASAVQFLCESWIRDHCGYRRALIPTLEELEAAGVVEVWQGADDSFALRLCGYDDCAPGSLKRRRGPSRYAPPEPHRPALGWSRDVPSTPKGRPLPSQGTGSRARVKNKNKKERDLDPHASSSRARADEGSNDPNGSGPGEVEPGRESLAPDELAALDGFLEEYRKRMRLGAGRRRTGFFGEDGHFEVERKLLELRARSPRVFLLVAEGFWQAWDGRETGEALPNRVEVELERYAISLGVPNVLATLLAEPGAPS